MTNIKLLLADDQDLIRESLHIVLDMDPEIDVVGLAENGKVAVDMCETNRPDVVLMDIHMPQMDGVEATRQIKARWPETRVIILTTFQEVNYVVDALAAGAEGYLLKAIHPKDLAAGIKWVSRGGTLIPQDIAKLLVTHVQNGGAGGDAGATGASGGSGTGVGSGGYGAGSANGNVGYGGSGLGGAAGQLAHGGGNGGSGSRADAYGLSEREQQVLQCIADGLNNREIAEKLYLSEGTVKNYISSIYSKMDVRDRIQAAKKAHDEGML